MIPVLRLQRLLHYDKLFAACETEGENSAVEYAYSIHWKGRRAGLPSNVG